MPYFQPPSVIANADTDAQLEPDLVPGHEIRVRCVECRFTVIVGGYVDDIDRDSYTCLECRVRESGVSWPAQQRGAA